MDVDSKIPNLALMKLSAFHKAKGDEVGFGVEDPHKVYASILFTKNKFEISLLPFQYPKAEIIRGGPGYDPSLKLPREIEIYSPDYSIYPDYKDSIGRVTIGCIRNCYFCLVPKMGNIRFIQHPREIYQGGKLRLLDDNLLAKPKAWKKTVKFLIDNNITAIFETFDILLITKEIANDLSKIKHDGMIHFSYDITDKNYEKKIINNIKLLNNSGIPNSKLTFFIYCHDENHIPDALHRWKFIREIPGVNPFLMVNPENKTKRLKRIQKKAVRPMIWRYLTPEEVFQ